MDFFWRAVRKISGPPAEQYAQSIVENERAYNRRADRGQQNRAASDLQSVANQFVIFVGNRSGECFDRAVEHFGGQDTGDANYQEKPFVLADAKNHPGDDDHRGYEKVGEEVTLSADADFDSSTRLAELVDPRSRFVRIKIIIHQIYSSP